MSDLSRQKGLVDSSILNTPITIIGAGGIGSFTTLAFAKVGFMNIKVMDFDKVEEHNLPNQFYPIKGIGKPKVKALRDMVKQFEEIDVEMIDDAFTDSSKEILSGVVVSAVDSMEVRKDIYNATKRNGNVKAFIDGRMGRNQLEVYTCDTSNNKDREIYLSTWCSDAEAEQVPCTERAVIYNVLTIASFIVNQTRLVLMGKPYSRAIILDLETMIMVIPEFKDKKKIPAHHYDRSSPIMIGVDNE